jgi:hypothetical protein
MGCDHETVDPTRGEENGQNKAAGGRTGDGCREHPTIKPILGVARCMGKALGIDGKWVYAIVKQVGNYGESFERNVGKDNPLKIDRGLNELRTRAVAARAADPLRPGRRRVADGLLHLACCLQALPRRHLG